MTMKKISANLIPDLTGTDFKYIACDFDDEDYWHMFTSKPKLDKDDEWLPKFTESDLPEWRDVSWIDGLPDVLKGLKAKDTLFEIEYQGELL